MNSPADKKEPFLIFGSPLIEQEEIDEVVSCMKSSWLGTGPRVARFEQVSRRVEAYRCSNAWQVGYVDQGTIALPRLDAALSIDEIYADVE